MAKDNLSAVLYGINDLRLVSTTLRKHIELAQLRLLIFESNALLLFRLSYKLLLA